MFGDRGEPPDLLARLPLLLVLLILGLSEAITTTSALLELPTVDLVLLLLLSLCWGRCCCCCCCCGTGDDDGVAPPPPPAVWCFGRLIIVVFDTLISFLSLLWGVAPRGKDLLLDLSAMTLLLLILLLSLLLS